MARLIKVRVSHNKIAETSKKHGMLNMEQMVEQILKDQSQPGRLIRVHEIEWTDTQIIFTIWYAGELRSPAAGIYSKLAEAIQETVEIVQAARKAQEARMDLERLVRKHYPNGLD